MLTFSRLHDLIFKMPPKKRYEYLSAIYDRLYERAMELSKKNYCQVKCGNCIRGRKKQINGPAWCCEGCKFLTATGCSINALTCRVWICSSANLHITKKLAPTRDKLRHLEQLVHKFGFFGNRYTKEQSLAKAMKTFAVKAWRPYGFDIVAKSGLKMAV